MDAQGKESDSVLSRLLGHPGGGDMVLRSPGTVLRAPASLTVRVGNSLALQLLRSGLCDVLQVVLVTQACPTLWDPMDCSPPGSSVHGDSPRKNTGMGCHALFQGIFPTQGSNSGLPHCRRILYPLSHEGSPRILEWVAILFSRRSSRPGDQTWVSCIAGGFSTA